MPLDNKEPHRRGAADAAQQPSGSVKPKTPSNTVLAFALREEENHIDDAALVAAMDDENADPLLHPAQTRALSHIEQREENRLRGDPWRFAVAPIFCLLSISNAMQWIAFSPIVDEVRTYFHMNATQVNFLATTYVIAYVVIVFLSCKLYEVTGIKIGVLIAAAANALGALLKIIALYAWPNAALLYLAQVSNSFTEVLTIATPPLISNRWFPEKERMVANTVMSSALNFGCGIGVLIPTFFVGPDKQSKKHFGNFFWFHFAYAALVLALVVFLFPRKPRYAASHVAARQQNREERRLRALDHVLHRRHSDEDEESDNRPHPHVGQKKGVAKGKNEPLVAGVTDACKEGSCDVAAAAAGNQCASSNGTAVEHVIDEIQDAESESEREEPEVQPVNVFSVLMDCFREFRSNWSFILLAISSAAELGLIWGVATVLPQMLAPYGISEAMAGWIGFLNLVLGTVVCPFFMPLVDRYGRRYKLLLCALSVMVVIVMVLLTLLLHFGPAVHENSKHYVTAVFVLWGGVAGICQNFMMPLMFEYVVELTFPMAESTSAPVLTWTACLTNFLLTLIFGEVLTDTPTENKALRTFIGATVVSFIGCVTLFLTKPLTKRTDYEKRQAEALEQRKMRLQSAAAVAAGMNGACLHYDVDGAPVGVSAAQPPVAHQNSAHSHHDGEATKVKRA
ncbi:MFS transporter [Leishmania donovani]|uniref:MFS_transporter_-_putative n=3 Tax=Leishmania donovani species complex TaxID=38574 RepID=A0A6L0WH24_LEIIN|nr:putative MFS transporter [Leishmania infantum JPCM5]XP_003858004.1 MFS transporter, putative [Leishmania donovani]CAC9439131.1 MFS_transporter_-_putative [Leishmania infantum]AYU75715.1 MFS transporter, putative [Leishmania donovani]CAJ1985782.1 MFS transporter [Leishmania donovani]CAM60014.1 putative MFS transporter [Leishmania infantum JPCM5]CBZ31280.1 MFS transporter, putative [Leishmania donovani]|eukprot:XP_001462793.1 putative MFS transporter [Leishmania infantum JPCM5]